MYPSDPIPDLSRWLGVWQPGPDGQDRMAQVSLGLAGGLVVARTEGARMGPIRWGGRSGWWKGWGIEMAGREERGRRGGGGM